MNKEDIEEYSKKVNEFSCQFLSQDLIIKKQQQELERYKNIVDKAIEYIKNIDNYLEIGGDMLGNNYIKVDSGFIFKLEDILKGEENEY